jgi:hypothetical protein
MRARATTFHSMHSLSLIIATVTLLVAATTPATAQTAPFGVTMQRVGGDVVLEVGPVDIPANGSGNVPGRLDIRTRPSRAVAVTSGPAVSIPLRSSMKTHRRDFLGWLGGTSMFAFAAVPESFHVPRAPGAAHAAAIDDAFDVSWTDRVQGKFRAVFDSPEISEGAGLFRAIVWCDEYKSVYGTARSDMSPVLVLRHEAIHLAMNDEYWKRFKIGKQIRLKSAAGKKWAEANPIGVASPDTPPQFASYDLVHFLADGGIVLACHLAFQDVTAKFRKEDSLDAAAAENAAREHLVPGVIMQPSGIFAVLRAQEAGCKYIMAS